MTLGRTRKSPAVTPMRLETILDEAARLINQRGVSTKPLADIADRMQLSRAAIYYYVADREDLVFKVYRRTCELLGERLRCAIAGGGSALEIVQRFVVGETDPEAYELSGLSEIGLLRDDDRAEILGLYEALVERLGLVISGGIGSGAIRECDADVVARTVISIVISVPTLGAWNVPIVGPRALSRRDQVALITDILADGWMVDRSKTVDPALTDLTAVAVPQVSPFDRQALDHGKREAILVAASLLFNRKGIDSTSMDDIAAAIGATKRTLYVRVGDKQAIVSAAILRTSRVLQALFEAAWPPAAQRDSTPETLVTFTRSLAMARQRADIGILRSGYGLGAADPRTLQLVIAEVRSGNAARLQVYREMQAAGAMRRFNPDGLVGLWVYAFNWLGRGLVTTQGPDQVRVAKEAAELLRVGLRPL
jgi:AcrR family transcriptional regulator